MSLSVASTPARPPYAPAWATAPEALPEVGAAGTSSTEGGTAGTSSTQGGAAGTSSTEAGSPDADVAVAADPSPGSGDGPTIGDLQDVMSAMIALLLASENGDEREGVCQVQCTQQERQLALTQQMQQIQREAHDTSGQGFFHCIGKLLGDVTVDAVELRFGKLAGDARADASACDNPKFWSDLELGAKIVAAVAAAAATVCTVGAAGPVVAGVAVALSASGLAVQETHCLGEASGWVGDGLALGGAAVSCGGTLLASTAAAAGSFALTAESAANATGAAASVVSGAAHLGVTEFQADALDAQADAQSAKQAAAFFAQMEQWAIDVVSEEVQSHQGAMDAVASAMKTNEQGSLIAANALWRG